MLVKGNRNIFPAVVTAYDDNGEFSHSRMEKVFAMLVEAGVSGLFVGGSTAEWPLLTVKERKDQAKIAVDVADKKVPVLMHISSLIPAEIIDYAKWAKENGVTALSVLMPWYFGYPEEGLIAFFSKILNEVELPVLLYNIPGNVKNVLKPELVEKLSAKFENLAGVKDSSMDYLRLQEFLAGNYAHSMNIFTGNDAQIVPAMMTGATGAVSAACGAFPEFVLKMIQMIDINPTKAIEMQQHILRYRAMVISNPPMSILKAALKYRGLPVGTPRMPLCGISPAKEADLIELIKREGLLDV